MTAADAATGRRDFGLSLTVCGIVAALALAILHAYFPEGVTNHDISTAAPIAGGCALAASIACWLLLSDKLANELVAAALATLLLYGLTQTAIWLVQTSPYRSASDVADGWSARIRQDYEHVTAWTPASTRTSQFGTETTSVEHGMFVVAVSSDRDETALTAPDGRNQPIIGSEFFLQATVTASPGATDGFCALAFGLTKSEHWFAVRVGPQGVGLTQDFGGLTMHRDLYGPTPFAFATDTTNLVTVLSHDGRVQAFVNRHLVDDRALTLPAGTTWVAPQAANRPDAVRCSYDDYEVLTPP